MSVSQEVRVAGGDPTTFTLLARFKSDRINLVAHSTIKEGLEDEIFDLGRERPLELFEPGCAVIVGYG